MRAAQGFRIGGLTRPARIRSTDFVRLFEIIDHLFGLLHVIQGLVYCLDDIAWLISGNFMPGIRHNHQSAISGLS